MERKWVLRAVIWIATLREMSRAESGEEKENGLLKSGETDRDLVGMALE